MTPSSLPEAPRPMRRLFAYLRPYRGRLGLATSASVANKIYAALWHVQPGDLAVSRF